MSTLFTVPDHLEVAYRKTLSILIKSWLPERLKGISDEHWLRELSNASTRKSVVASSVKVASNLFTSVNVVNLKSWREAALISGRSQIIYDLRQQELQGRLGVRLRELISQNSRYISDIPKDVADQLFREIASAQQQGTRPEAIAKILRFRFPQIVDSKIKMVARTQSSSANSNLIRARCEDLGINCFTWRNSRDQRVRPSHRNMDGVVCFWGDLPSPEALIGLKPSLGHYCAGDCPNCRCNPFPVLHTEDIFSKEHSIARVYHDNVIQMLNKTQFTKLSGIESRIAA